MVRDRSTFRVRDLKAALAVARAEGLTVARILIGQDGVELILKNGDNATGQERGTSTKFDERWFQNVLDKAEKI